MHHLIQTLFQYRLPVLLVLTLLVIIGCSASPSRGASKIVDFRQRDLAKISIEHTPSTAVVSQPIQNNYALLLLENAIRLQLADENRLQTDDAIHSLRLQLKILSYQDNVLLAQGKLYDDDEYLVYSQVKRRFAANEDWEEVMELVAEQMLDELMLKMRDLQQSAISEAPTKYFAYSSSYGNVRTYSTTIYSSNLSYSDPYYNNWGWWRRPRDDHHRHGHNAHRHDHQNKHHDEKHQDHHSENHPRRHWVGNGPITNPHLPGSGGKPRRDSKPNPTPATLPTNGLEAVVNPITEPSTGPIVMPIDTTTATPTVGSNTELPVSSGIDNNAGNTATPSVDATGLPLTSVLPNNGSEATVNPITEPNTGPVVPSINSGPTTTTTNPTTDNSTGLPASPSVNTEIATPPVGTSVDTNLTPNSGSNTGPATLPSFDSGSSAPTLIDPNIGISPDPSAGTIAIDPSIAPSVGTRSGSNSGTSYDSGSSSTPNSSTNTEDSGIGSNGSIATTPSSGIESGSTGDSSSVPASSPSYSSGSSVGSASMDSNSSYSSGSSSSSSSSDSSPSYNSGSAVGSSSMDSSPSYSSGSSSSSSSSSAPEPAPAPPSPPPAPEPTPPPPPKSAPPASDNTATPPSP